MKFVPADAYVYHFWSKLSCNIHATWSTDFSLFLYIILKACLLDDDVGAFEEGLGVLDEDEDDEVVAAVVVVAADDDD